jgi:hypothetical protein
MSANPNDDDLWPRPPVNSQAGRVLAASDPAEAGVIATGDRRDEMHFEADANQLVVVRHLVRPQGLAPELQGPGAAAADADEPPVEDVAVGYEGSSVWDARPLDE